MKITGTLLVRSNEPDTQGDIINDDTLVEFKHEGKRLPVRNNFDGPIVGTADLKTSDDGVTVEIDYFAGESKELTKNMIENNLIYAVPGGRIINREGNVIKALSIDSVGLTTSPALKNVPTVSIEGHVIGEKK